MSRHCQVTGATPGFGHNVPWSKKKTDRYFNVSVQIRRHWIPSLERRVRLTVSAKGIKVINTRGIDTVIADLITRGRKL